MLLFTYSPVTSVVALVSRVIPRSKVYVIRNDQIPFKTLLPFLQCFSAIIVGPGPGSPLIPSDIGVVKDIWHVPDALLTPVFGVCLGLQSLAVEFGAKLMRLRVVKHGQVSPIYHSGDDIFQGLPQLCHVVRYHSLCVDTTYSSELSEIAWVNDGADNGVVVMGLKHNSRPFWAVQYHPESVCTDSSGQSVFQNFWRLASEWRSSFGTKTRPWDDAATSLFGEPWPHLPHLDVKRIASPTIKVSTSILILPHLSVTRLCEAIGSLKEDSDFVLLDSAAQPGRFTISGCLHPDTIKIQYFVNNSFLSVYQGHKRTDVPLGTSDIWTWLASFMQDRKATGGAPDVPFWGGLIGYLSYELGVVSLGVDVRRKNTTQGQGSPDVNLVFVDRSVVIDSLTGRVYLQSLLGDDDEWFASTSQSLERAAGLYGKDKEDMAGQTRPREPKIEVPDRQYYMSRVKDCQEFLFSGDSYELCYTARTKVTLPRASSKSSQSWNLYKTVRTVNPAPYAAYLRLYPTTLLSSSPERFLSYSRPPSRRLQLRPIKGTVRKGQGITRQHAEAILNTPKEIGENLMIVDLIRHDLYGVVGRNVEVTKFCGIEEYETVWQLVSVIDGTSEGNESGCADIGWEMLKRSLPPGK